MQIDKIEKILIKIFKPILSGRKIAANNFMSANLCKCKMEKYRFN